MFARSVSVTIVTSKRVHTGDRPYKCNICDKHFTQLVHLNQHSFTHTGAKQYKCDVCKKLFSHKANLKTHKRIHSDLDTQNLPNVSKECTEQSSIVSSNNLQNDSTICQKIRYRSKSIDYIVEKMATKNPNVVYLVWSKKFTMDLASTVARSGRNVVLIAKKFEPASFPDLLSLSNTVQTALIKIGQDAKTFRLFSFGGMVLPERIVPHGGFKSLTKLESKLARFSRSQGMELVHIFKHAENKNGGYASLSVGLKGNCIITDRL